MTNTPENWLESVAFNSDGLVPAIAQDAKTGTILMVAWMNAEALEKTVASKQAVYWSRSRQALWHKGEQSGHYQIVHEIRLDCDGDVILLQVEQAGGIACHTGRQRCFYQKLDSSGPQPVWQITDPVLKNPDDIYS